MYYQETKLDTIVNYIWDRKIPFLVVVAALFFAIHGVTLAVGSFNPKKIKALQAITSVEKEATTTATTPIEATSTVAYSNQNQKAASKKLHQTTQTGITVSTPAKESFPTRIVISKFNIDAPVSNPSTTSIVGLDAILTKAVVRYPGSGTMENGNMLIMGHSSELPMVHNPFYKIFNTLKRLEAGDEIKVYAGTKINTYAVKSVRMLNVKDEEAYIPFTNEGNKLTLVTCNVLGAKDERYIVEADLVY